MALHYTDTVPSKVGYYWVRNFQGSRIIELTEAHFRSNFPIHWKAKKAESLAAANPDVLEKLLTLDDSHWLTEFAGPIAEPVN